MSIATRIQAIEEHISDAYDNLSKFGVAAPSNKNIENIASLVDEIYDNTPKTDYASGTDLTLENTRVGKIDFKDTDTIEKIGLGATDQLITTGANKLVYPYTYDARTVNGITFTPNGDGSVTVDGTATGNAVFVLNNDTTTGLRQLLLDNDCFLSGCPTGGSSSSYRIQLYGWAAAGNGTKNDYGSGVSLADFVNEEKSFNIAIYVPTGIAVDNLIFKPMLNIGSSKLPFEPYTGGVAVPNPSSPKNINIVTGNQNVLIKNKNLIEEVFKGYNINAQGKFETGGTSLDFDVNIAKVQAGETYILNTITNVIAYFDTKPTTSSTSYNNAREAITATNTLTPTRSGYIAIRTATSNTTQLEKGTTATSYVPHQENNYEISLGTIELCKTDTYQDYIYKNGKNWYLHKEIEKVILNNYTWALADNTAISNINTHRWATSYPCSRATDTMQITMSNILPMKTVNDTWGQDILAIAQSATQLIIRMPAEYTTASAVETALQNLNAHAYTLMNTPTDTQITDSTLISQLNAWYNAQSTNDITYITVDGDLPIQLKLKALKK